MKNYSVNQPITTVQSVNPGNGVTQKLSDDAFYLIALMSQLKKMIGPAARRYIPSTCKPIDFSSSC